MTNAIECTHLTKRLGTFTLGSLNLVVPRGSIVGYIGENGAGKSTTLKLFLGLMRPDEGEIRIGGKNVAEMTPEDRAKIGFVFDDLYLPGSMRLMQVERFHKKLYGSLWENAVFERLIHRFHLPEDRPIGQYSRGMKMKLGLALALSHGAELLLLDEATSGLDPVVRDDVLDLLLEFQQDPAHTVLVSSHILSDLEKIADYIAFLHEGQLRFMETKDELLMTYGRMTLTEEQLQELMREAVIGMRKHAFGIETLVRRDRVPAGWEVEPVTIEDVMVLMVKGGQNVRADL